MNIATLSSLFVGQVRQNTDLTARQTAILLTLAYPERTGLNTVRGLASFLRIGKPAVTRAADTLTRIGYVERRRNPKDGRDVLLSTTKRGEQHISAMLELTAAVGEAKTVSTSTRR